MSNNLEIIDAVIVNLNNLTVQGVKNMHNVVENVKLLDVLRQNLAAAEKETKDDAVQNTAE